MAKQEKLPKKKKRIQEQSVMPIIPESAEQTLVFQWADWYKNRYPELRLLHHIPNGGSRNPIEAVRLKAQGVKPGVPDLCLPVPRGGYHGLYIEMKRKDGGRTSKEQKMWLLELQAQGYKAKLCRGSEDAIREITSYLMLEAKS